MSHQDHHDSTSEHHSEAAAQQQAAEDSHAAQEHGEHMHDHDQQHEQHEQPEQHEADHHDGHHHGGEEVLDILASVEDQLERLRGLQHDHDGQLTSLEERSHQLEESERHLSEQHDHLQQQQTSLQQQQHELDQHRQQLQGRQQELEHTQREIHETRSHLDRQRAEIDASHQQLMAELEQREAAVNQQKHEVDQQRQGMEARESQLREEVDARTQQLREAAEELQSRQQNLDALQQSFEQMQGELNHERERAEHTHNELQSHQSRVQQLEASVHDAGERAAHLQQELEEQTASLGGQVEELRNQVQQRDTEIDDHRSKLDTAAERLTGLSQALKEQEPRVEQGAAAMAMVQQQRQQIERLTQQLAQHKYSADPSIIRAKDERITELVEALRQARGQAAGDDSAVAELEQRAEQLYSENEQLRVEIERANVDADNLRTQLEGGAAEASDSDTQERALAERDVEISRLTQVNTQLQQEIDADAAGAEQVGAQRTEQIDSLQQQIEQLGDQLEEARAQVVAPPDNTEYENAAAELRKNARTVRAAAEHLQRRRRRLKQVRESLYQGRRTVVAATEQAQVSEQRIEEFEANWQQLAEVREFLAASETQMIKRWARSRAVFTMVWIAFLGAALAAGSWFGVDRFAPAVVTGSVVLEAQRGDGEPLTANEAEMWRLWHTQIVKDGGFAKTLARRLGERRLDQYADVTVLAARLEQDLTLDTSEPGALRLVLAGTDKREITAMLDVFAATLATASSRQMGRRPDAARAVIRGDVGDGKGSYSTISAVPVEDNRLNTAAIVFAGGVVASGLFFLLIYRRLARSKRVFDEDTVFVDSTEFTAAA